MRFEKIITFIILHLLLLTYEGYGQQCLLGGNDIPEWTQATYPQGTIMRLPGQINGENKW
jgi:hypothetical protein